MEIVKPLDCWTQCTPTLSGLTFISIFKLKAKYKYSYLLFTLFFTQQFVFLLPSLSLLSSLPFNLEDPIWKPAYRRSEGTSAICSRKRAPLQMLCNGESIEGKILASWVEQEAQPTESRHQDRYVSALPSHPSLLGRALPGWSILQGAF